MSYAILRVAKIKADSVKGANAHNTREMQVPNADPKQQDQNVQLVGTNNLQQDIQNRLDEVGIKQHRKDAVLCIEHMMTTSPEFLEDKNPQKWGKFEKECMNWLKDQYGEKNVINVHIHKDEKTPHIHAMITPITQDGRLSCKDFLNGADKLRKMQDSFAEHIQKSGLELHRGQKGSKATHTEIKDFYTHIKEAQKVKNEINFQINTPKIEIEKPSRLENLDNYKSNTEQEIQKQVNSIQEETQQIVLDALKPLKHVNTLLLEESRLKSKLDSENKQLRTMLLNANTEIQKLKGENTELKKTVVVWANNCNKTLKPDFKITEENRTKFLNMSANVVNKYTPKPTEPKKEEMTGEKKEIKTEQKKQEPSTEPKKEVKTEQTTQKEPQKKPKKGMSM
jgi:hypothetical protein